MQKNSEKGKYKLTIAIPQSAKKLEQISPEEEEIYVKPVYSTKNARKPLVKFSFDEGKMETARDRKSKKLEREKDMLLKSFDVLKVSAISAIAEKQEQIDTLRSQIVGDQVRALEDEVEQLMRERRELKEEVEELQEKLKFERQSYMRLLEEKDRVIEELYVELGSTQIQIEKLQKFQEMKEKKIKIIEEQNNYLFHQLQEEKIAHIKQAYQNAEIAINFPSPAPFQIEEAFPVTETPNNKEPSAREDSQKLTVLESRHREELNQLTLFYEKRLSEMREIYQRQLQLWPIEHSKDNSINNELMEDVVSLKPTVVPVAHKLSNELKLLSDCYSMTKRDPSKCDQSSIQASDRDPIDYNFRFLKRAANTPVSHTTSSLKVEDRLKFMVAEKRHQTEASDEKKSDKQQSSIEQEKRLDWKGNGSVTSFMLGALTGGTVAFLFSIFQK